MASDVRARRLGPEEGLLAAALHVQSLRAAGRTVPTGHLDRFASIWGRHWAALPTWVAEHDATHGGVIMVQLPAPVPAEVLPPQWARVVLLYAVPSGPAERTVLELLRTAADWLTGADDAAAEVAGLELADGVHVPPAVLDTVGAQVDERRRVRITVGR